MMGVRLAFSVLAIVGALAACGGGGSSSVPSSATLVSSPTPVATTTPQTGLTGSTTLVIPAGGGAVALPPVSGYTGTISLRAATSGAGSNVAVVTQAGSPGGLPVIQAHRAMAQNNQPLFFVTFTFASTVTLSGYPGFSFTLPGGASTNGTFSLWFYDATKSSRGWQILVGPAAASGSTVTFGPGNSALTFASGMAYQFALVFAPNAPTPTPPPTTSSTATPFSVPALTIAFFSPAPSSHTCGYGGYFPSIALGADGNVWVTSSGSSSLGCVGSVSSAGAFTFYQLSGSPSRSPMGLTLGADGALWFTESAGNLIGRIDTSGNISEYSAINSGGAIARGSDGNIWYAQGAGIFAFSPTSHTIVGTAALPTGTAITQLVSNPATGDMIVDSQSSTGAGTIYKFAPGVSPAVSSVYTAPASATLGTMLALGSTNIFGVLTAPVGSALLVFSQASYSQSSISLPSMFSFAGESFQTNFQPALVAGSNGDIYLANGCNVYRYCGAGFTRFDVAQITSAGIVVGQGPNIPGHQITEVQQYSGAVIGPEGNAWFLYEDVAGLALGSVERVTPNAH